MPDKYFAITIGPIYKTFQDVRKTRELWAASYIFSYISKGIIEKIRGIDKASILVPYFSETSPVGIGLYPDRIFLKESDSLTIEIIEGFKNDVLSEISLWINGGASIGFLKQYFRIYVIEYETPKNPLVLGNQLLDSAELRSSWTLVEPTNELLHFLRKINTLRISDKKWIKNHLSETDIYGEIRFESLPEISTRAIREVNAGTYKKLVKKYCYSDVDIDEDDGFIKDLKAALNIKGQPEIFKNYHKYVCIVKADGDRVGKYIKAIDKDFETELAMLSESLYNWAIDSAKLIKAYSGIPIYIGGDDVLFLAPVTGLNDVNILGLTKALNKSFEDHFKKLPERKDIETGAIIKPTLSFSISVTYYKYPLFEAVDKAGELLYKAKETRNACSLSLLKHSGSSFDITISNDEENAIAKSFSGADKHFADNLSFVSSIIHHFRQNESVYRIIGVNKQKVVDFLENNFEEKKYRDYVLSVAAICHSVYQKNNGTNTKEASEKSIKEIHSLLRILKFLNGQEDGK